MDSISIRYGESLTLPLNTGSTSDVSADIFIGKPGEAYVLTKNISLTGGVGTFEFTDDDTKIPLDTYYYQINVTDEDGKIDKYPAPDSCNTCDEVGFPTFIVGEALDLTEVS